LIYEFEIPRLGVALTRPWFLSHRSKVSFMLWDFQTLEVIDSIASALPLTCIFLTLKQPQMICRLTMLCNFGTLLWS
jgi:hypothetical protein